MSYAGCPGLSPAISAQFTFEMCIAAGNRKKIHQKFLFWGIKVIQGHRRLTAIKTCYYFLL